MSKTKPDRYEGFINFLEELRVDRGAMAALRKGLGHRPGTIASMYRYVEPFIKEGNWDYEIYYLIAMLFAYYENEESNPGNTGNMGDHFRDSLKKPVESTSDGESPVEPAELSSDKESPVEKRFAALLTADFEDLCRYHLRQAVFYLKSKNNVAINWLQLMKDLAYWSHPDSIIQRRWAGQFWRSQSVKNKEPKGE